MRRVAGLDYLEYLRRLHAERQPAWYLEIGTRTGRSLALSRARSIAIDPRFRLAADAVGGKPELHLFQMTSDDVFRQGHLERLDAAIDLAFLDGMHRYEFLLRDFMNTERFMAPGGEILLHDCVPWCRAMTVRDQADCPIPQWTGDVWKLVPILRTYRPDLRVTVLDCAPTGLVSVTGLDPGNRELFRRYDEIIAAFDARDDVEATVNAFELVPVAPVTPGAAAPALAGRGGLAFAIQTPVPRPRGQRTWGDYHFALGLAQAFERQGVPARVQTRKHWGQVGHPGEIDLVIRGVAPYQKRAGHRLIYWMISQSGEDFLPELDAADHVFAAGEPARAWLAGRLGAERVTLLPQAFDAGRMYPPEPQAPRSGRLFVGIARRFMRPIVGYSLASDIEIELWGSGWEESPAAKWLRGGRIENEDLGGHYRRAAVVLCDHTPLMRKWGLTSNRIFDALACAAPVVSDDVAWIPPRPARLRACRTFGRGLPAGGGRGRGGRRRPAAGAPRAGRCHARKAQLRCPGRRHHRKGTGAGRMTAAGRDAA
ncbi:MAG: class I SAM-dependent methyltransferase [Rhodobacteraceae bacterium]|nr:class I SAM-dependent methyltransferase [Paracoccaceae bacterium]